MNWQKRALRLLCVASCVGSVFGQAYTSPEITVSSNTLTMVAGSAAYKGAASWVSNTAYSQGAVVKSQSGTTYFALIGGTSTNVAGAGPVGMGNVVDGTVTWRHMLPYARSSLVVQDVGTSSSAKTYVLFIYGAQTNLANAVTLYGAGGSVSWNPGEVPQSATYVLSTLNTKVTVFEQ